MSGTKILSTIIFCRYTKDAIQPFHQIRWNWNHQNNVINRKTYWTCLFNQTKMQFIMRFHCIEFICRNRQLVKHFLLTNTNIVFTINQNMAKTSPGLIHCFSDLGVINYNNFQLNLHKIAYFCSSLRENCNGDLFSFVQFTPERNE